MAGLESIALAVEQLEEASRERQAGLAPSVSHLPETSAVPILPEQTIFAKSLRVVSLDAPSFLANDAASSISEKAPQDQQQPLVSPHHPREDSAVNTTEASMSNLEDILGPDEESSEQHADPASSEIILRVLKNDVLCGRGGETNHHSGNIQYRHFVKSCQPAYIAAKRRDKPRIAERIVESVRRLGGRFLKKDAHSNTWRDVGNTKAREKTSQALREGAPELRTTGPVVKDKVKFAENFYVPMMGTPQQQHYKRLVVPHVVETSSMMDFSTPPPTKARRTSLDSLAASASSAYSIPVKFTNLQLPQPQGLSPVSSSTADDDSHQSSQSKSLGGPRIKYLKRRLEKDETSI